MQAYLGNSIDLTEFLQLDGEVGYLKDDPSYVEEARSFIQDYVK
jgi:hypothetical protein